MEKITNFRAFILFPFVVFAFAWLLDKAFFVGDIPDYFLRTGSFVNYRHKLDLTDQLQAYLLEPGHKKTVVLFGNSRTMTFDNAYIARTHPDWVLFNFSVPGGTTDYFHYVLKRFKAKKIRPDFVVMTVSPQGFNAAPVSSMDEVMVEGLPIGFLLRYAGRYSLDDMSNVFAKRLFWSYQYRPKIGLMIQRMENDALLARAYAAFRARLYAILYENRGSVPRDEPAAPSNAFLEKSAHDIYRDFFTPFRMHQGQVLFTADVLKITREMNTPTILLWARVAPPLRDLKDKLPAGKSIRATWEPAMERLASANGAGFLNMNYGPSIKCDAFYDASHMAANCFPEFTDYLFASIEKQTGGASGRKNP